MIVRRFTPARRQDEALLNYWDDVIPHYPAIPVPPPDAPGDLTPLIRELHTIADDARRPREWHDSFLRTLLATYDDFAPTPTPITPLPIPLRPTPVNQPARARAHRRWFPVFEAAVLAVFILTTVTGVWLANDNDNRARIAAPTSESIFDVPMYRADPGRTGVMPGPGIDGDPVMVLASNLSGRLGSQPALAGDLLYVGAGTYGIAAVDIHTGAVRWVFNDSTWGFLQPPSVADGTVYVVDDYGSVFALDAATGAERWRFEDEYRDRYRFAPLVDEGVVYTASSSGAFVALDAATGDLIWRREFPGEDALPTALDGDLLYVTTGDGAVHALAIADGHEVWTVAMSMDPSVNGVAVVNGLVYVTTGTPMWITDAGYVAALDAETGALVWRLDAEPGFGFTPPVITGETIYVASADPGGRVLALDAQTGAVRWEAGTGNPVSYPPALAGDQLYFGTLGGMLVALDAETGTLDWSIDLDDRDVYAPIASDGVIYVGSLNGTLYAIAGSNADLSAYPATPAATPTMAGPDRATAVALGLTAILAATAGQGTRTSRPRMDGGPGGPESAALDPDSADASPIRGEDVAAGPDPDALRIALESCLDTAIQLVYALSIHLDHPPVAGGDEAIQIDGVPSIPARSRCDASPEAPAHQLTLRQMDVVRLLAAGKSNRAIADSLSISERTVENHVFHILERLGLESRTAVAAWAVRTGIG